MKTKKKELFLLGGVLLAVLLVMLYYGGKKEYLYEDEVLSYTSANNEDGLYYQLQEGEWITGDSLNRALYAAPGETFDYRMVMKNQISDTHPPVYFLILHTICSFFPGVFSKWMALSINIVSLMVTLIIFYKFVKELFPHRPYFPSILCLVYGLSLGTLTQTMFLRMYMLLQVFIMLCIYLHIHEITKYRQNRKCTVDFNIKLILVTFLGTMTHYYYLIFAFFMAVFYCVWMLVKKRYRETGLYVGTMVAAGGVVLLAYPAIWTHLLSKEVGSSAFHQDLSLSNLYTKYHTMLEFVNQEVWGGYMKILLLVFVLFVIYGIVRKRDFFGDMKKRGFSFFMLFGVSICYFILVSTVTPYLCDRYVYPVFPVLLLLTVLFLEELCEATLKSRNLGYCLITLFLLLPAVLQMKEGLTDVNKELMQQSAAKYSKLPCVFSTGIPVEENVFELNKYQDIYVYDFKEPIEDSQITEAKGLVVYVPNTETPEEDLKKITESNPALTQYDRIYTAYYSYAYYVH